MVRSLHPELVLLEGWGQGDLRSLVPPFDDIDCRWYNASGFERVFLSNVIL